MITDTRVQEKLERLKNIDYSNSRDIRDYADFLDLLVENVKLGLEVKAKITEREKYNFFVNGLPYVIKEKHIFSNIASIEESIDSLSKFETLRRNERNLTDRNPAKRYMTITHQDDMNRIQIIEKIVKKGVSSYRRVRYR